MKFFYKISCLFLGATVITLTFSCIFQVVSLTQEREGMKRYQDQVTALQKKQRESFVGSSVTISLREVEEKAQERNFVQSQSITYIDASSRAVVRR